MFTAALHTVTNFQAKIPELFQNAAAPRQYMLLAETSEGKSENNDLSCGPLFSGCPIRWLPLRARVS